MLDKKIKLYVPSTTENSKVDYTLQEFFNKKTLEVFSDEFGGATMYTVRGAWKNEAGGVTVEDITIVESFYSELTELALEKVQTLAKEIKDCMYQEAVSLEINNQLNFI